MRYKYANQWHIERKFPTLFIFGEHADGKTVDLATPEDSTFIDGISREDAGKIIKDRDLMIDLLVSLSEALESIDSKSCHKIWKDIGVNFFINENKKSAEG